MPSSSTSSVAFDDDEIETPNTKRRRTSLQGANVSETELRRQVLQLELKFLEKKEEFFDRVSGKVEKLIENASEYYDRKLMKKNEEEYVIEGGMTYSQMKKV
uniref:Uncharacterized protein n=1 Tax=Meloidogyne javanica TaxID=6303 RepID=A0A915NC85_MELJA